VKYGCDELGGLVFEECGGLCFFVERDEVEIPLENLQASWVSIEIVQFGGDHGG